MVSRDLLVLFVMFLQKGQRCCIARYPRSARWLDHSVKVHLRELPQIRAHGQLEPLLVSAKAAQADHHAHDRLEIEEWLVRDGPRAPN